MNNLAFNSSHWAVIIMAAGTGYRLQSSLPKPLHLVNGRAMIMRLIDVLEEIRIQPIVIVVGHQAQLVKSEILTQASNPEILRFIIQEQQIGTGDASQVGLRAITESYAEITDVLILNCDTPLLQVQTVSQLMQLHEHQQATMTFLTAEVDNPSGLGRIVREGSDIKIVEESEATAVQKQIREINAGVYCFNRQVLTQNLKKLRPHDCQTKFYLTDLVALLGDNDLLVKTMTAPNTLEVMGVNTLDQLALCNKIAKSHF